MKRTMLFVATLAITTLLSVTTGKSEATPPEPPKEKAIVTGNANVASKPGKGNVAGKGNAAKGRRANAYVRGYRGFRNYCYYPAYHCYLFFDPATRQWYFWSDRTGQFLPVNYITAYPPLTSGANLLPPGTIAGAPLGGAVTNPIGATGAAGVPALPPGATAIPADPLQPVVPVLP
jgi:hypothetical protein